MSELSHVCSWRAELSPLNIEPLLSSVIHQKQFTQDQLHLPSLPKSHGFSCLLLRLPCSGSCNHKQPNGRSCSPSSTSASAGHTYCSDHPHSSHLTTYSCTPRSESPSPVSCSYNSYNSSTSHNSYACISTLAIIDSSDPQASHLPFLLAPASESMNDRLDIHRTNNSCVIYPLL